MSYPNKLLLEQGTLNSSGLNGVYTDSGELLDGKPKYIKDGGTAYIRWYTSTTQWAVVATPTILVGPSDPLDPTGEYDAYSGATGTATVTEYTGDTMNVLITNDDDLGLAGAAIKVQWIDEKNLKVWDYDASTPAWVLHSGTVVGSLSPAISVNATSNLYVVPIPDAIRADDSKFPRYVRMHIYQSGVTTLVTMAGNVDVKTGQVFNPYYFVMPNTSKLPPKRGTV